MNTCGIIRCLVDMNYKSGMSDVLSSALRQRAARAAELSKLAKLSIRLRQPRARARSLSTVVETCFKGVVSHAKPSGLCRTTVEFPGKLRDYSTPRDSGIQIVKCRSESGHAVENAVDSRSWYFFSINFLCGMLHV